jgi:hypothetical protein
MSKKPSKKKAVPIQVWSMSQANSSLTDEPQHRRNMESGAVPTSDRRR